MKARGYTLLEVAIAGTVFVALFAAATRVMIEDRTATRVLTAQVGPEMRARHALETMASELRMAAIRGEDRNSDGTLDPLEDVNVNYEFDADWSLSDGTQDQATLDFNRRLTVLTSPEEFATATTFSRGIAYSIQGDELVRTTRHIDPNTGTVVTRKAVMAEGVSGLRFSRDGFIVTISVDVSLPPGAFRNPHRTLTERVLLRN